jgi:hypothetical protein
MNGDHRVVGDVVDDKSGDDKHELRGHDGGQDLPEAAVYNEDLVLVSAFGG